MKTFDPLRARWPPITRRQFTKAAVGGLFVLGASRSFARGATGAMSHATQSVLSGTQFDLNLGVAPFNFTGAERAAPS